MSNQNEDLPKKNIRLTFDAWTMLRELKYKQKYSTFSALVKDLLEGVEELDLETYMENKEETPSFQKTEKTIVLTEDLHEKLTDFKVDYMLKSGATSRGKGSVSISDVMIVLINYVKSKTP